MANDPDVTVGIIVGNDVLSPGDPRVPTCDCTSFCICGGCSGDLGTLPGHAPHVALCDWDAYRDDGED